MSTNELYEILNNTKRLINTDHPDLINHMDASLEVILKARESNNLNVYGSMFMMNVAVELLNLFEAYRLFINVDLSNMKPGSPEDSAKYLLQGFTFDPLTPAGITRELIKATYAKLFDELIKEFFKLLKTIVVEDNKKLINYPLFSQSATLADRTASIHNLIYDELIAVKNKVALTKSHDLTDMFIVTSPVIVSVMQSHKDDNGDYVFAPAPEGSFKGPTNMLLCGTWYGAKVYSSLITDPLYSTKLSHLLAGYNGVNVPTLKPSSGLYNNIKTEYCHETYEPKTAFMFNVPTISDLEMKPDTEKNYAFIEFDFN